MHTHAGSPGPGTLLLAVFAASAGQWGLPLWGGHSEKEARVPTQGPPGAPSKARGGCRKADLLCRCDP